MSGIEGKPLKGILITGDEPRKKKHVGGISLAADDGHDAEKKEHRYEIVEGKDGAIVKDSDGRVIREEEVKKSRKSNKEHQMIHKSKPEDGISHDDADGIISHDPPAAVEQSQPEPSAPAPSPKGDKEKKKKKGLFW